MLIKIPVSRLAEHGRDRPPSFLTAVWSSANLVGDTLEIDMQDWGRLVRIHGVLGVPAEIMAARTKACARCDWTRLNEGRSYCDHPARSCAKLSPHRASEQCLLGLWPTMPDQPARKLPAARQRGPKEGAHLTAHAQKLDEAIAGMEKTLAALKARRSAITAKVHALKADSTPLATPVQDPPQTPKTRA